MLTSASACPQSCKCKTPKTVDCSRRGLTTIPSDIPATAEQIDLSMNNIAEVPDNAFKAAPNLLKIDLHHNSIATLGDAAFSGLTYLKDLFLVTNRLDDNTDWTSINGLQHLQHLYLSHNHLTKIPAIQNPSILSLILDGNQIASAAFPAEISLCLALQSVVLSSNNIQALTSSDLANLKQLTIKNLDFKLNALSQIDPDAFKPIGLTLESLSLDHNRLDASMLKNAFTALASAHTLALLELSIGYNPITALDKDLFSPLSTSNLRNLQIDGMTFKTVDPASLAPVQKNLQLLSMKECGFSKAPLDFSALSALQDLR